jgi:hypothetical protein
MSRGVHRASARAQALSAGSKNVAQRRNSAFMAGSAIRGRLLRCLLQGHTPAVTEAWCAQHRDCTR